jgi:hypothetical protein
MKKAILVLVIAFFNIPGLLDPLGFFSGLGFELCPSSRILKNTREH